MIDVICHNRKMRQLVNPDYPNRIEFNCRRCGNNMAVSNQERLEWVVSGFEDHGLTEVNITAFRKAYTRFWVAAQKAAAQ